VSDTLSTPSQAFCTQCGRSFTVDDLMRFGESYVCADCKPSFLQRVREGVPVGAALTYGSAGKRVVAAIIDTVILFLVGLVVNLVTAAPRTVTPGSIASVFTLGTFVNLVIGFAYYVYLLTTYGATLGKMAMGLKVVTAENGPLSGGRATGRYFCATFLEPLTLGIGLLIALFDDQRRTLHDRICGTRVITNR
jgi:uncharacterized RDD family membrane protein YckC